MHGLTTHCFSVELAAKIGLREAIVLQHLYWWHQQNSAREEMNIDGRVWFYLTPAQVAEVFPYLSANAVRNILNELIEEGYLVKDHKGEGQQKFNRTNWYALTICALDLFHLTILSNGDDKNCKSIVNNKDNNKVNNLTSPTPSVINLPYNSDSFLEVWQTLRRQPKWKKKSVDALQASADFLKAYPEGMAIRIMQASIRNGWQGLFAPKAGDIEGKTSSAQSRAHDARIAAEERLAATLAEEQHALIDGRAAL